MSKLSLRSTKPIASPPLVCRWKRPARVFSKSLEVTRFLKRIGARDGAVLIYLRHTSASLVVQENADPDVRADLVTALRRLAPANAGWVHDVEGPDDMPAHVKSMLNGVSLQIPVSEGDLALGAWQGIYVAEHRTSPHRREVALQFCGSCANSDKASD